MKVKLVFLWFLAFSLICSASDVQDGDKSQEFHYFSYLPKEIQARILWYGLRQSKVPKIVFRRIDDSCDTCDRQEGKIIDWAQEEYHNLVKEFKGVLQNEPMKDEFLPSQSIETEDTNEALSYFNENNYNYIRKGYGAIRKMFTRYPCVIFALACHPIFIRSSEYVMIYTKTLSLWKKSEKKWQLKAMFNFNKVIDKKMLEEVGEGEYYSTLPFENVYFGKTSFVIETKDRKCAFLFEPPELTINNMQRILKNAGICKKLKPAFSI